MPHSKVAKQQIPQHRHNSGAPYRRQHRSAGFRGADACRSLRKRSNVRIHCRHRLHMNQGCIDRLLKGNRCLWNQADRAFNGERQQQPDRHNRPQNADNPLRCFLEKKAEKDYRKNQPVRPNTVFNNCPEDHYSPSPASSIIFRTRSRSASVSARLFVNAARNAGKEPWKVLSTNCWLCNA